MKLRTAWSSCALILGATLALSAVAQNTPPAGGPPPGGGAGGPPAAGGGGGRAGGTPPTPAEQAIGYRKALYTLVGGNFGPIGGVLQGRAEYNAADIAKRAERLAFLASMAGDAFPEISKDGNTKAKPEIWTDKAGFAKVLKDFEDSTAAFAALVKKDNTNSAAFKAAAGKVGESCKGCHDGFRAK